MSVRKRAWVTSQGESREAWIVDYTDQQGGRHIRTFDRKKDADAYEATVRVDVRTGVHTSSKATVADAGKHWIASCKAHGLEASTLESYQQHLDDHIVPYLGAVKLSQLTVPLVRDFMDRLRANGRSPAMVKRVVGDLGSILADAQERGEVAQSQQAQEAPRGRAPPEGQAQDRRRHPHARRDQGHCGAPTGPVASPAPDRHLRRSTSLRDTGPAVGRCGPEEIGGPCPAAR
jgi:integrase